MTVETTPLEAALRQDRLALITALLLVLAAAWAFLLAGAGMDGRNDMAGMAGMPGMVMAPAPWDAAYFAAMLAMWAVMMAAMMLPGAAPMILLFAALERKQRTATAPHAATTLFVLGYLLVWAGFSLGATLAEWGLAAAALLSPAMATTSRIVAGLVLLGAGLYQFTPLKQACLRHCRAPFAFLVRYWRPRTGGALMLGLRHGAYCVGCCWMLMALLFVGGVMNFAWIAAIALYVLAEKTAPAGLVPWLGRLAGLAMAAWGAVMLSGGIVFA